MAKQVDGSILEMALVGYAAELRNIEGKMAAIRKQLGGRVSITSLSFSGGAGPKRQMSAAARKRIALAQKKRWRAFHPRKKAATGGAKKAA
jgi:hypothetical protein